MSYVHFASTYGSCAYDSSTYQTGQSCGTGGGNTGTSGGGGLLSNTGLDIALIVTLACVIAFTALVIRVWKRPNKSSSNSPAALGK